MMEIEIKSVQIGIVVGAVLFLCVLLAGWSWYIGGELTATRNREREKNRMYLVAQENYVIAREQLKQAREKLSEYEAKDIANEIKSGRMITVPQGDQES